MGLVLLLFAASFMENDGIFNFPMQLLTLSGSNCAEFGGRFANWGAVDPKRVQFGNKVRIQLPDLSSGCLGRQILAAKILILLLLRAFTSFFLDQSDTVLAVICAFHIGFVHVPPTDFSH